MCEATHRAMASLMMATLATTAFAPLNTAFGSDEYTSTQDRFQSYPNANCGFSPTAGTDR